MRLQQTPVKCYRAESKSGNCWVKKTTRYVPIGLSTPAPRIQEPFASQLMSLDFRCRNQMALPFSETHPFPTSA